MSGICRLFDGESCMLHRKLVARRITKARVLTYFGFIRMRVSMMGIKKMDGWPKHPARVDELKTYYHSVGINKMLYVLTVIS